MPHRQLFRADSDAYCPRVYEQVLIIDTVCFFPRRNERCRSCLFDVNRVLVKLVLLLASKLNRGF